MKSSIFDSDVRIKEIYPDMKVIGRAKVGDRDAPVDDAIFAMPEANPPSSAPR
jgi:hypothetical protein